MKMVMFSKKLAEYDIGGVGRVVSQLGFDGVDLTVRPGGHILPVDAKDKLPAAMETLQSHGLEVPMITTGVTSADEAHASEVFEAASECGVEYLKLGYWHYEGFGSIARQLKEVRSKLVGIQGLAAENGIIVGIHIHSGDFMTATGGMVSRILEGMDTKYLGAYIDPGHMVLEGGRSGWRLGMDLLRDVIKMVAVKDFGWEKDPKVAKRWSLRHMPLDEGMVPWPEVFGYLKGVSFDGPVSFHSEYEDLSTAGIISQTAKDLAYVKAVLAKAWGPG